MTYNQDSDLIHYLKYCYSTLGIYSDDSKLDLAIALLADVLGINEALVYYNTFKTQVIDDWNEDWEISDQEIINFIKQRKESLYGNPAKLF